MMRATCSCSSRKISKSWEKTRHHMAVATGLPHRHDTHHDARMSQATRTNTETLEPMPLWWGNRPYFRHREDFWAFTGPRRDFGLILLILDIIMHRSFTCPTHLLSANVPGPVISFVVSDTCRNSPGSLPKRLLKPMKSLCHYSDFIWVLQYLKSPANLIVCSTTI